MAPSLPVMAFLIRDDIQIGMIYQCIGDRLQRFFDGEAASLGILDGRAHCVVDFVLQSGIHLTLLHALNLRFSPPNPDQPAQSQTSHPRSMC
jgi:hypothetical protein